MVNYVLNKNQVSPTNRIITRKALEDSDVYKVSSNLRSSFIKLIQSLNPKTSIADSLKTLSFFVLTETGNYKCRFDWP